MRNDIVEQDIIQIVKALGSSVNQLEGKRVLITGASGLIGGYLVDTLAYLNENKFKKKTTIIALQRKKINKNSSRFRHLIGRSDIDFILHDASLPFRPKKKVDYLIHSAGLSAPASFLADPLGTIDVNVSGIRWILEYARRNKVKSVLYMSSGEIYGNPTIENIPTPESYNGNVSTLDPRACYTSSKRLSETLCRIYFEKYKVPIKIARPFIVYGPGLLVGDKRVMAEFIRNGILQNPIVMLNDGKDTRSYCYISDATIVFFKLLLSSENGEVFNVASDMEEISIKDLANLVHKLCGIEESVQVKKKDAKFISGAPTRVKPDIKKIKRKLNYHPQVGIEEGLRRTIDWNKDVLGISNSRSN